MQEKEREKYKTDRGRDQEYRNKGADIEICELR